MPPDIQKQLWPRVLYIDMSGKEGSVIPFPLFYRFGEESLYEISRFLAEELKQKKGFTVITNSVDVFETLNRTPGIILISTGGAVRFSTQALVGPTAEVALKELRADKLFLMVSGITLDFGLSHHAISEVTIKQAMINSAREIIVVADHTAFMADVGIQVAPLEAVHKLITDDALPPSTRLNFSKAGIQVVIV